MNEHSLSREQVMELACNLDDMTAEDIAFAQQLLLEAGALDVWTCAIGMKKNRPGVMLSCLCPAGQEERFAALMLRHTTTLGVRMRPWDRLTLPRSSQTVQTAAGPVRCKQAAGKLPKPEYEDLARIARAEQIPLPQARQLVQRAIDAVYCQQENPNEKTDL